MSLEYDDIPGSWGTYSEGWPGMVCKDQQEADRAFVACSREKVVPYGSYVMVGLTLRVESDEYLPKLKAHLAASPFKTANEVLDNERSQSGIQQS